MALFSPRGCRTWKEGNCTGRYAYWWISKSLSEWQYKNAFALMQDVSLVSMRPLVMLLDGGPATFLAQTKAPDLWSPLTFPGTSQVPGSHWEGLYLHEANCLEILPHHWKTVSTDQIYHVVIALNLCRNNCLVKGVASPTHLQCT